MHFPRFEIFNFCHSRFFLKNISLTVKVVKNQRITDYSAANHFLSEIMKYPSDKWEDLKLKFYPIFKQLTIELDNSFAFNEFYSRMETELHMVQNSLNIDALSKYLPSSKKEEETSKLSSILSELGILEACTKYQLRASAHRKYTNLVHISPTVLPSLLLMQ